MAFTVPARRAEILSSHVAPLAGYLNGDNSTDYEQIASRFGNSTSLYADSVTQLDTTNGYAFRAGYGARGSQTWLLDVKKSGVRGKYLDKGGHVVNVKAYETTANTVGVGGSTDADSVAIEAAFAAAEALALAMYAVNGDGRTVTVHFPAGTYNLARPIEPPLIAGLRITGDGVQATRFGLATGTGSNNAAYWSTKAMMYIVGGNFNRLENFSIQPDNTSSSSAIVPAFGLAFGPNDGGTNPFGSTLSDNATNALYTDKVRVAGAFIKAAHVNYACPSSVYVDCDFYRNKSPNATYPNGVDMNEATVVLTRDNSIGLVAGPTGPALVPYTDGTTSCSDISFFGCEIHDEVGYSGSTPTTCACPAVWIEEGYSIRFSGGKNWSGRGSTCGYLRLSPGRTLGGTLYGCHNIVIDGVQMYEGDGVSASAAPLTAIVVTGNPSDNASVTRERVINDSGASATFAIVASDVTIKNCHIKVANNGALLGGRKVDGGSGTATWIRARVENVELQNASDTYVNKDYMALFSGSAVGNLIDCDLECGGLKIDLNSAQPRRGKLYKPGTITHGPGSALVFFGSNGVIETGNDTYWYARNAANSGMVQIAGLNGSNTVLLGGTSDNAGVQIDAASGQSIVGRVNSTTVTTTSSAGFALTGNTYVQPGTLSGTPVANALYQSNIVKAWAYIDTDGTLLAGHNVTTSKVATGQYRVTIDRDFSSTNYVVVASAHYNSAGTTASLINCQEQISARTAGQFEIICNRLSDGAVTDTKVSVICMGTQ